MLPPDGGDRAIDSAITAYRHCGEDLGDVPEKLIAIARRKRTASIHHGGQFGIAEADRLRHRGALPMDEWRARMYSGRIIPLRAPSAMPVAGPFLSRDQRLDWRRRFQPP